MLTSQNGGQLPSRRRGDLDLSGTINSIIAAYLATRSIIIAVIVAVTAVLLVIADQTRPR